MRPYSPAATWEEYLGPPYNSKGGLIPLRQLKRNPEFLASTHNEVRPNSPAATREESGVPHHNLKGCLTPLGQQDRLPEINVATQVEPRASLCNSRKTTRFISQRKMRPDSPVATWEQSWLPPGKLKGGLTPFLQLKRLPKILVATGEEPLVSHLNLRWGPILLTLTTEVPLTTRKEAWLPWGNQSGSLRSLWQLEGNPEISIATQEEPRVSSLNSR